MAILNVHYQEESYCKNGEFDIKNESKIDPSTCILFYIYQKVSGVLGDVEGIVPVIIKKTSHMAYNKYCIY